MSFGDINSGATPQPGGVVYRGAETAEDAKTVQEEVAQATQDALNGEGAFANVEAGIKNDPVITAPVVEADDQAAQDGDTEGGEGDYDPADYTVPEVLEYLESHPDEREAVLAKERDGKDRVTITEATFDDGEDDEDSE